MSRNVVIADVLVDKPILVFSGTVVGEHQRRRFVAERGLVFRAPKAGEVWRVGGRVTRHRLYGEQVVVDEAVLERPSGRLVTHVLAGARFPGIGPKTAERLWQTYGEGLYKILADGDEAALTAVTGSDAKGRAQAATILQGWPGLALEADTMAWLERHAVDPKLALKIIGCYGDGTIEALREDPYRLAVFGAGWGEADRVARSMGLGDDDPHRLCAAVEHCLHKRFSAAGDTIVETDDLRGDLARLVGPELVEAALEVASTLGACLPTSLGWQSAGCAALEGFIAGDIARRLKGGTAQHRPTVGAGTQTSLDGWQARSGMTLNSGQRQAVEMALVAPFSVITGGAGTGKTAIIAAIGALASDRGERTALVALSGRAALRITEATGLPAMTVAGFLQRYEVDPTALPSRLLTIVDEASMVDVTLLYRLLSVLEDRGRILLVGDPGQLPPIGPGLTLHALAGGTAIPTTVLDEVVRQAASTGIPSAGVDLRRGVVPRAIEERCVSGVRFVDARPEDVAEAAIALRDDGVGNTQILSAFKGRPTSGGGTRHINDLCHARRPPGPVMFDRFARGEPVIWTQNDYDVGLMNGELGVVQGGECDLEDGGRGLEVAFGDRKLCLTRQQTTHLELAYAITVHKAQGSQFDRVIIPIVEHVILDRTLIYTALTRARVEAVFVGDRVAFRQAVSDPPSSSRRRTALTWHLDNNLRLRDSGDRDSVLTEP